MQDYIFVFSLIWVDLYGIMTPIYLDLLTLIKSI